MQMKLDWFAPSGRILEDVFCRVWFCSCGWTGVLGLRLRLLPSPLLPLPLRLRLSPVLHIDPKNHEIEGTDQNTKA